MTPSPVALRRSTVASCVGPCAGVLDRDLQLVLLAALDEAVAVAFVDELPRVREHRARQRFDLDLGGRDVARRVARLADLDAEAVDAIERVLRDLRPSR